MFLPIFLVFAGMTTVLDAKSCILSQGPKAVKCLENFGKLGEAASNYDLTDPKSTQPTNELCGKFKRCIPSFSCEHEQKIVYAVNITVLFCDAIGFFTNEFLPCQVKLDSNTTECTRAWSPFPDKTTDEKLMREIQKEACKNYFGKDNCMREEIIDVCGVEQWNGFKKHHLALNTIIGSCDHIEI